jgi:fumarate reductase flavoprotein subunit
LHTSGQVDLVVVGAGLAGCVAALTAADSGARVMLIEKSNASGGSSVMSADCYAFAGTDVQLRSGVHDTADLLYEDLVSVGKGENSPAVVSAYTSEQLATFEWLRSCGAVFSDKVDTGAGQTVPRVHTTDTARLIGRLLRQCADTGRVSVQFSTEAVRLLRGAMGSINVVLADYSGARQQISSQLGVILATGGFTNDSRLVHRYAPQYDDAMRVSAPGATGDGLRMACALGAELLDMAYIKGTFGVRANSSGAELNCMAVYKGAIAINQAGRRFVDESQSYKILGDACMSQPGQVAHQILDQDILETGEPSVRILDLMHHYREGLFVTADTLEELARRIQVPAAALMDAVDTYNSYVRDGLDKDFGRQHLVHRYGRLRPILRPPFHAYPSAVAIFGTYCGIAVDEHMQVRDVFGDVISGLYAAGEVVGGFHGAAYMTGTGLGKAAVFGRIAARSALATNLGETDGLR